MGLLFVDPRADRQVVMHSVAAISSYTMLGAIHAYQLIHPPIRVTTSTHHRLCVSSVNQTPYPTWTGVCIMHCSVQNFSGIKHLSQPKVTKYQSVTAYVNILQRFDDDTVIHAQDHHRQITTPFILLSQLQVTTIV